MDSPILKTLIALIFNEWLLIEEKRDRGGTFIINPSKFGGKQESRGLEYLAFSMEIEPLKRLRKLRDNRTDIEMYVYSIKF